MNDIPGFVSGSIDISGEVLWLGGPCNSEHCDFTGNASAGSCDTGTESDSLGGSFSVQLLASVGIDELASSSPLYSSRT